MGDDEDENFVMHNKYDKSYKVVAKKVDGVYLTAKTYVNLKNYAHAIFLYTKAVQALELSQLKDEAEQIEQQSYLIKLYTNLCVCYNKKEEPKKTCLMVFCRIYCFGVIYRYLLVGQGIASLDKC